MVKPGVMSQVGDGRWDWVNSFVIREKPDGRLHIFLDPEDLTKVMKRKHYPGPTVDDITPRLCGTRQNSRLDAPQSYWNSPHAKEHKPWRHSTHTGVGIIFPGYPLV